MDLCPVPTKTDLPTDYRLVIEPLATYTSPPFSPFLSLLHPHQPICVSTTDLLATNPHHLATILSKRPLFDGVAGFILLYLYLGSPEHSHCLTVAVFNFLRFYEAFVLSRLPRRRLATGASREITQYIHAALDVHSTMHNQDQEQLQLGE